MKIERIEVFGVAVPLAGEFATAYESRTVQRSAVVRVTATGGGIGLGNVDPVPGYSEETVEQTIQALERDFGPRIIGLDPSNIHRLLEQMDAVAPGFLDAKAAIEMACVDLTCRALGIPAHVYLGGAVRDTLRINGWIGIVSPDQAATEAASWHRRGFRSVKIKVGGGIDLDRERIRAVRAATDPDFGIRIDANAGYDADTSIRLARQVAQFDLQLFEQPAPADDLAGLVRVRRDGAIPVMADESVLDHASLLRVIEAKAADIVKVKVMKQGGMLNTRRMLATAEAAGIRCVIGHGFGLGINTMAEVMVAATARNVIDGLECVGPLNVADDVVVSRPDIGNGSIRLPLDPGLGMTLDPQRLARYRFH